MATGTSRSPRTNHEDSRVARLHRSDDGDGSLSLRPRLDYGSEIRTILVFGAMIAINLILLLSLVYWGGLDPGSDGGLVLAFSLGIIVTCAFSSSLAFLILLRHKLIPLALASLGLVIVAIIFENGTLEGLSKLVFATSAGLWISLLLTSIAQIVLISGLIIVVDFYSVFLGPTKKIVESGTAWVDYLTINMPVFGAPALSQLGVSDIIFFGLFAGVSISYTLRRTATAFAMTVSLIATMTIGVSLGIGVPALPLLAIFFLLANADVMLRRYLRESGEGRDDHGY